MLVLNRSVVVVVVIPCYKVENHILEVVSAIPPDVSYIITVNDCSPDSTGEILEKISKDNARVLYLKHDINKGVGGAMKTGFAKALELGADVVIKMDGDGQMDQKYIPKLLYPIFEGRADFAKGNRFRDYKSLKKMPVLRRVGNLGLSFLTKAASGYWNIFDPTNGYFAINKESLESIDFDDLHNRYFFETSLLIELYHTNAVIEDVSMPAQYGDEVSNLSITRVLFEFPPKLIAGFVKRVFLKYYLYDFNIASIYLLVGFPLFLLGSFYGIEKFYEYGAKHVSAPTGTVVIPTLMITLGFQLILSAINFDLNNYPKK